MIEGGGADWDHEDLLENHWVNELEIPDNGMDDDDNGFIDDYDGWNATNGTDDIPGGNHGTQVSSMIGSVGNDMIGVADHSWQSMYHFTVGLPVEDPRLTTFPAYHHLEDNRRSGEMEP